MITCMQFDNSLIYLDHNVNVLVLHQNTFGTFIEKNMENIL